MPVDGHCACKPEERSAYQDVEDTLRKYCHHRLLASLLGVFEKLPTGFDDTDGMYLLPVWKQVDAVLCVFLFKKCETELIDKTLGDDVCLCARVRYGLNSFPLEQTL